MGGRDAWEDEMHGRSRCMGGRDAWEDEMHGRSDEMHERMRSMGGRSVQQWRGWRCGEEERRRPSRMLNKVTACREQVTTDVDELRMGLPN